MLIKNYYLITQIINGAALAPNVEIITSCDNLNSGFDTKLCTFQLNFRYYIRWL